MWYVCLPPGLNSYAETWNKAVLTCCKALSHRLSVCVNENLLTSSVRTTDLQPRSKPETS